MSVITKQTSAAYGFRATCGSSDLLLLLLKRVNPGGLIKSWFSSVNYAVSPHLVNPIRVVYVQKHFKPGLNQHKIRSKVGLNPD